MKTKVTLLSALAFIVMLSSCGDAELEKRVANLERRINQMENGSVVRNTTTPTQSAQAIEASVSSGASFQWEKTMHNFGTINQGEVVNFTYKFTNNGTEDLLVQSASASCGCTVPKKPTGPIAPGEQGEIVVRYDSKGKSGQVSPVITIVANTNPRQTRLSLRGFVQVSAVPQP